MADAPLPSSGNPTRGGTHIIYPWTVRDAKAQLQATADGVNQTATSCTGLDAPTSASWTSFYGALSSFVKEDVSIFGLGSQMDRVQSYEDSLYGWSQYLATKCAGAAPIVNPNPPEAPNPWIRAIQFVAVAAVAVAGAYGVARVVELIPTPGERAAARRELGPKREKA